MRKDVLIRTIAEEVEIPQTAVESVLERLLKIAGDELLTKKEFRLPGLGKFEAVRLSATTRRNPFNGTTFEAPAHDKIRFRPFAPLARAVKEASL